MARSAGDINPNDVFPPRNLTGNAEAWGRTLEDRIVALEKAALGQQNSIGGTNRNIAASTASLADQIQYLQEKVQLHFWQFLSLNSTTGFLNGYTIARPSWASVAVVMSGPPIETQGSMDTRGFYLTISASKSPTPNINDPYFASYYATSSSVSPNESMSSVVVGFDAGEDFLYLTPYQNVDVSGTGTMGFVPYVTIFWLAAEV